MDSIGRFIDTVKLTQSKKAGVEKAMHSLLFEWKNLEHVDSSSQQLLQDCFADIQLRRDQLNAAQESITIRKKELDETAKSSHQQLEEVKKREKDFQVMCEEKSKEVEFGVKKLRLMKGILEKGTEDLDLKYKKIDATKKFIEEVFEKFRLEMNEFERIKGVVDERFEEVKLKEKSIESSEIELLRVLAQVDEKLKTVAVKEKDFELREKNINNRQMELDRVRNEFTEIVKSVVEKEKEFVLKEKDIENRQIRLDRDLIKVDGKMKNVIEKEKEIVSIQNLIEKNMKEVESREECCISKEKKLDMVEKVVDKRVKELEIKEKNFKEWVETIDEKEKEIDLKEREIELKEKDFVSIRNFIEKKIKEVQSREEHCVLKEKKLDMVKKVIDKRAKELEVNDKYFKERVKTIDSKEKEISSKDDLTKERCIELESRGKRLVDLRNEYEMKEKHIKEWVKRIDLKEKEISSKDDLIKERCIELESREKRLVTQQNEYEMKEKHLKEWVKTIDSKEKEIDSKDVLSKEKCNELESREKRLVDRLNEFELKEKHFKEWAKKIHSARILNRERCKKIDSKEKNISDKLIALNKKEQHIENCIKTFEAEKEEFHSFRISCEEKSRKLILEKERLEHQIKELEEKNKQFSNVGHSIVKQEPWTDDRSYADIRLCTPMNGLELLLYLIDHKRDLDSMNDEVFKALGLSMDPAKLVLDAMQQFYLIKADKNFEEDVVCRSSIIMLEQLRRRTSQIPPHLKRAALKLASNWKSLMKSSLEFIVFLQLLASYGLQSAFKPEEFLGNFEVLDQHIQKVELCQLLGYTHRVTDLIEVMLKDQQHVKAVKYVCAFGLREKFQPASLLKDFMKIAEEAAKTLCEDKNNQVNKKDKAYDNIVASLKEAVSCILHYKLESEYSLDCITRFIEKLMQEKNDDKNRLSGSNIEKNCKSDILVPDPTETCTKPGQETNGPIVDTKNAIAVILSKMDGKGFQQFLNENPEDHELIRDDVFNSLNLLRESAKLVLEAIGGFYQHYESTVSMRSCILLLEQLMKLSPEIKPSVKDDARKLACVWKAKMRTPLEILGFLHLVTTYGLYSVFEVNELEKLFDSVSYLRHAPQLCQAIRFLETSPNHTMTSSHICNWHDKDSSNLEMKKTLNNRAGFLQSANSVKLLLDAMRGCYYSNRNGNQILNSFEVKSFILLAEALLNNSKPIQPHVEEAALKFAVDWKAQILDKRSTNLVELEVFGLFNLLALYKVDSAVDSNELLSLLHSIYLRKKAPQLVRLLGLELRIPEFIESLIRKGNRLQAIRYIYEFDLVRKFQPVHILKEHISVKKLLSMTETSHNDKAVTKQLASLREVVRCIRDHKLEAEYPAKDLLAQIQKLEKQPMEIRKRADMPKKFGKKRNAAVSDLGSEAQRRSSMRKYPRIEPLGETSLNVPPPAFHAMTPVIGFKEAYVQKNTTPLIFYPHNAQFG